MVVATKYVVLTVMTDVTRVGQATQKRSKKAEEMSKENSQVQ
jgi:hypothetical protein